MRLEIEEAEGNERHAERSQKRERKAVRICVQRETIKGECARAQMWEMSPRRTGYAKGGKREL